ncbi:DUF4175 family protein, partial [Methylobacterium trifolii]
MSTDDPNAGTLKAGTPETARLDRLVAQARMAGLWERAWPLLWRALAVLLAFAAVSWLGLWLDVRPVWRMAGLGAFALAILAVFAPA